MNEDKQLLWKVVVATFPLHCPFHIVISSLRVG